MDNCRWNLLLESCLCRSHCVCESNSVLCFLYSIICYACVEFFSFLYLPLSSSLLLLEESLELELELERLSSSSLSLEPFSGFFVVIVVVDAVVELKLLLSRCRFNDVFFRMCVCVFGIVIGREKYKKYKNSYKDTLSSLSVSFHCSKNTKQTNNTTHTHARKK